MAHRIGTCKTIAYKTQLLSSAYVYLYSFMVTLIILLLIFWHMHLAPFGNGSLVYADAYLQYMDFFAFLKDVLTGANAISYTFSSNLGSSYIGQFAYYLASPFNVLLLFFSKGNLYSFYDLITALKMGLAASTFSYYAVKRFPSLKTIFVLLLSVGYGLMGYNLQQAGNTMWMDGVYMLPLILLGVYQAIAERKVLLLSTSVRASILFNWYTGGINCFFACIWFVVEGWLREFGFNWKTWRSAAYRFLLSMFIGVLLSLVLFLPAILQLRNGVGSGFDWSMLSLHKQGHLWNTLGGYYMGLDSTTDRAALFSGSLGILGAWQLLVSGCKKERCLAGILFLLTVAIFHWKPFFFLFSLLKDASSYWFRYSYLGCFMILFLGAVYFSKWKQRSYTRKQFILGLLLPIYIWTMNLIRPNEHQYYLYETMLVMVIMNSLLYAWKQRYESKNKSRYLQALLAFLTFAELGTHSYLLVKQKHISNDVDFRNYTLAQQQQVNGIKKLDSSYYRIMQTSNKQNLGNFNNTVVYNEAVAFGYWGIGGYTSVPQNRQMAFLEKLGYREEFHRMNIVNTAVLPTNSFLGVKYVLSAYPIEGLQLMEEVQEQNLKKVYRNPYALPLAFVYRDNQMTINEKENNPFIFTNEVFQKISGLSKPIYISVPVQQQEVKAGLVYQLRPNKGIGPVYGNIVYGKNLNGKVQVGNTYEISYGSWTTPSLFYIPESETKEITLTLSTKNKENIVESQFYQTDLGALEEAAERIQTHEAKGLRFANGQISGTVSGHFGEKLFLSIPVDSGWDIVLNGEKVKPEVFAGTLITLPLRDGENTLQMTYHIPGLYPGIGLSVAGIVLLAVWNRKLKRKRFMNQKVNY